MVVSRWLWRCGVLTLLAGVVGLTASEVTIRPLLQKHCYECHGVDEAKHDVDYESLTDEQLRSDAQLLDATEWMVAEHEMPTVKATHPLADADRERLVAWLRKALSDLENAAPNDPGVVVAPRINHSEYDYVVRDLTGLELELGQFLVPDNEAGEGFVNVGAAQNMTVGQFEAYLSTAKKLLSHALIVPGAPIHWSRASFSGVGEATAWRKALQSEYRRHASELHEELRKEYERAHRKHPGGLLGAYLEAAWRYQHRAVLGMPDADTATIAAQYDPPLFTGNIGKMVTLLEGGETVSGDFKLKAKNHGWQAFLDEWRGLPTPTGSADAEIARDAIVDLLEWADWATANGEFHRRLKTDIEVEIPGDEYFVHRGKVHRGRWPYEIDLTKVEGDSVYLGVSTLFDGNEHDHLIWHEGVVTFADGSEQPWQEVIPHFIHSDGSQRAWGSHPTGKQLAADAVGLQGGNWLSFQVPEGATGLRVSGDVDPDHKKQFAAQSIIDDAPPENMTKFGGRRYYFQRGTGEGAINSFINDRADDHGRGESAFYGFSQDELIVVGIPPDAPRWNQPQKWRQAGPLHTAMAELIDRLQAEEDPRLKPLAELRHFISTAAAHLDADTATLRSAAQQHIVAVGQWAWREPVPSATLDRLMALYDADRVEGRTFDSAVKTALSAVLLAPQFLYRFNDANDSEELRALSGRELATRLAFALWGSLPDKELLALGDRLQDEEVLMAQLQRMIADDRSIALAREFAGHWLQFHDFAAVAQPDEERFEDFPEVKDAMAAEAEMFFDDLFRNDRPLSNVIRSDYAYLNKRLAQWYGIDGVGHRDIRRVELSPEDQRRRGGVLGMGAILVKYSEPLRTSPVKRGAWLYEYLLGIHLPAPPDNVPLLSDDERNEEGQTVRQQLEQHRDNPACFSCHDKIDPPGIALEHFDAVGRWRDTDLAGEPIDDQGAFVATGRVLDGVEGLRMYVEEQQERFVRGFCEKLVGYCLGREVQPTDQPLLEQMMADLHANQLRPSVALVRIVTSQQFRFRRDSGL